MTVDPALKSLVATPDQPYLLGTMSGTSLDGIDLALARFDDPEQPIKTLDSHFSPYPESLWRALRDLRAGGLSYAQIADTEQRFTATTADVILTWLTQLSIPKHEIAAIGFHGHTLWHQPEGPLGFSWQMGSPSRLAALTGLNVVHDFRNADIAAGGQGAPLTPAFHQALFAETPQAIVLNLGGFANVTFIHADPNQTFAGDTGPANSLLDAWYQRHHQARLDDRGRWGASGKLHQALLERLLSHPYFRQPFPKSTGFESFHLEWLASCLQSFTRIPAEDVQCTLHHLSAQSIAQAINKHRNGGTLILCGGGIHNDFLLDLLGQALGPTFEKVSTDAFGLPPSAVEASAFAWLAFQFLLNLPGNLPAVTGAKRPVRLGSWTPAPM